MCILIIYIIIIILSYYVINSFSLGNKNRKNIIFLFLSSVLILSLYIYQDTTRFPDLPIYKTFFDYIISNGNVDLRADTIEFEKGYLVLNILLRYITDDFIIVKFVLALLLVIVLSISIYKYSKITWLSVFLFICILFYNTTYILRQSFALAVILFSFRYILKQDFLKYIVCIIIAFLFHKSALICIPLYFLYRIKIRFLSLLIACLISILMIYVFNVLLGFMSSYIQDLEYYNNLNSETISVITLMIPFSSLIFSLLCFRNMLNTLSGANQLFLWMGVIECVITLMSFIITEFNQFHRLNIYFSMGKIFLLPNAISLIVSCNLRKMIIVVWMLCWMIYLGVNVKSLYGFSLTI